MTTKKLNTVNASVNTPAIPTITRADLEMMRDAALAELDVELYDDACRDIAKLDEKELEATYLEDAVVVYANPQTEPSIPDFRYITAVKGNRRYYLLLHGAVRYGAIVKSKQARNIPYFEETINGKKYWVVDAVPSKEELEAYKASKTQKTGPAKVKRSEASVAFFAAAFKH